MFKSVVVNLLRCLRLPVEDDLNNLSCLLHCVFRVKIQ